jgi:hypothetical protein
MLQRQVLARLTALQPRAFFWRANTGGAKTDQGFIRFGVAGQADVLGVAGSRFVAIELKSDTGRQSAEQRAFEARITSAGGLYILARSVEQALTPVLELLR